MPLEEGVAGQISMAAPLPCAHHPKAEASPFATPPFDSGHAEGFPDTPVVHFIPPMTLCIKRCRSEPPSAQARTLARPAPPLFFTPGQQQTR